MEQQGELVRIMIAVVTVVQGTVPEAVILIKAYVAFVPVFVAQI